jgi:hypothetical protein
MREYALTLNTFGVDERSVEKQRYEMMTCFDFFNAFAVDERLVEKKDVSLVLRVIIYVSYL